MILNFVPPASWKSFKCMIVAIALFERTYPKIPLAAG